MIWGEIYTRKNRVVCSRRRKVIWRYNRIYKRGFPDVETIIVPEADWYFLVAPERGEKEFNQAFQVEAG